MPPTSHVVTARPARTAPPSRPGEPVVVGEPPSLAEAGAFGWWIYLFPVLGAMGALGFVAVNPNPIFLLGGGLFVVGALAMGVGLYVQQRGRRGTRLADVRRRYLDRLADDRARLREAARSQRERLDWHFPELAALPGLVGSPRMWERRPDDGDFLAVRLGTGDTGLEPPAVPPPDQDHDRDPDPLSARAVQQMLDLHTTVREVPRPVSLRGRGQVTLVGPREEIRARARALISQVAALHAPDEVRLAIWTDHDSADQWEWAKWLPHVRHPESDDDRPDLLLARDADELEQALGAELRSRSAAATVRPEAPHLLVVVDRTGPAGGPTGRDPLGRPMVDTTVLRLVERTEDEPGRVDLRLRVDGEATVVEPREGDVERVHRSDRTTLAEATGLATALTPYRLSASERSGGGAVTTVNELPILLGLGDSATFDPTAQWGPRSVSDELAVPIGVSPDGDPVHLDLKEAALGGMGPHGLAVGATGSGKSELLRTLVTGLAVTHPPDLLALVLVDYKGGATFAGLDPLPHVAGLITNLEDHAALVDRMHESLHGEIRRREELLHRAGQVANAREYRALRERDPSLEPLPTLLVVIDEFSELLAAQPHFIDLFVSIGRVGRSLGIHLLLATQRLEEGRLRGLESHLSYRLGLKTFNVTESRIVLGTPDAYELPSIPGSAYLKVDTTVYQRLRTATVSTPYVEPRARVRPAPVSPEPFEAWPRAGEDSARANRPFTQLSDPHRTSVMDVVAGRLRDSGAERAHQVWLPPLPPVIGLTSVLHDLAPDGDRGLQARGWSGRGTLRVPLGVVDLPRQQRQEIWVADLAAGGGNLAVVGAPRTGKSSALHSLVVSLACTHTPEEVQVHALDLSGGGLGALSGLPHVGTVAGRLDGERVRRVVQHLTSLLEHRERYFASEGIESLDSFRRRRREGTLHEDDHGDVFLLVDGWTVLRAEFEDLEPALIDLMTRGLGFGVHVVVATGRWTDLRPAAKDALATRVELRLGEPSDSAISRAEARLLPGDLPGRGLVADGLQCQVAAPVLDHDEETLRDPVASAVRRIADAWHGPVAAEVRMLPTRLDVRDLDGVVTADDRPGAVPIGIGEPHLEPAAVDLFTAAEPHFLVLGDSESGKTTTLRTLVRGLTRRLPPEQVRVLVVDYRRTLLDVVPESHLLGYAGAAPAAHDMVEQLAERMASRVPGPEVSSRELRERSWWSGPEAVLVVDDFDLVATGIGNPLERLVEYLPIGHDVGLHLVVARRTAGMARSAMEPTLRRLKEVGTPGLLLSGSRDEGPLLDGHRAGPQPTGRGLMVRRKHRPTLVQVAHDGGPETG